MLPLRNTVKLMQFLGNLWCFGLENVFLSDNKLP